MKYSEKISNRLNALLAKTYDAKKGYNLAMEKLENPAIKKFLSGKVQQRTTFGQELKAEIQKFGELPETDGSFKGDLHRAWMKLTSSLTGNEQERILEEVTRGEKASLKEYNEILSDGDISLIPSTRDLLIRQRDAIEAALKTSNTYEELVS